MDEITIKKDSMLVNYRDTLKISWSKLRHFTECQASWFCINYASILNVECVKVDQTHAVSGIIIQKLFETLINKRIYSSVSMPTYESLLKWFEVNTWELFNLTAKPIGDQFLPKYNNPRGYFKRKAGKDDLNKAYKSGLSKEIEPSQIAFVDFDIINKEWGNKEGLLNHLCDLYRPILDLMLEKGIILNKMFSEFYIKTKIKGITLNGYIDFVYNNNQECGLFSDLNQLKNDFIVLDGKIKVSKYVHKEQLMYYASLLYFRYKKLPSCVGFIDWTKAKFVMHEFDPEYILKLKDQIVKIQDKYIQIKDFLNKYKSSSVPLSEIDVKYSPSTNCIFCPIVLVCKSALAKKKDLVTFVKGIENRRETDSHLKNLGVDTHKQLQDVKL